MILNGLESHIRLKYKKVSLSLLVHNLFQGDSVKVTFIGANPRNDRKVSYFVQNK